MLNIAFDKADTVLNNRSFSMPHKKMALNIIRDVTAVSVVNTRMKMGDIPKSDDFAIKEMMLDAVFNSGLPDVIWLTLGRLGMPKNFWAMLYSVPTVSSVDTAKISFFLSDTDLLRGRRVRNTPEKFIGRHWNAKDHEIRDIVRALKTITGDYVKLDNINDFVNAVEEGPSSCMSDGIETEYHPYNCYDPKLGWRMFIRKRGYTIVSRVLVNDNTMSFVRSYGYEDDFVTDKYDGAEVCTDAAMESYLRDLGYTKQSRWPDGTQLSTMHQPRYDSSHYLAPYIDGDNRYCMVNIRTNIMTLTDKTNTVEGILGRGTKLIYAGNTEGMAKIRPNSVDMLTNSVVTDNDNVTSSDGKFTAPRGGKTGEHYNYDWAWWSDTDIHLNITANQYVPVPEDDIVVVARKDSDLEYRVEKNFLEQYKAKFPDTFTIREDGKCELTFKHKE